MRVFALAHPEGDARREVRLDHAGDHVDARPLRREDDVHAGGARLLREAGDADLDVLALLHHQVGELVDHDHDVGQLLGRQLGVGLLVAVGPSQISSPFGPMLRTLPARLGTSCSTGISPREHLSTRRCRW